MQFRLLNIIRNKFTAKRRSCDGFTLLEVLVSLAIMGMSLTVLFAIFSQCLERTADDQHRMAARNLAQSLMAQAEVLPDHHMVDTAGETSQGMKWQVQLRDYGNEIDKSAWSVRPVTIRVTVSWQSNGAERRFALTSMRLLPKKAAL